MTLQQLRREDLPKFPPLLENLRDLAPEASEKLPDLTDAANLFPHLKNKDLVAFKKVSQVSKEPPKPLNVGIVLSGGPAAGGHTVIGGVFHAIKQFHKDSRLIGFLGGPSGVIDNRFIELNAELVSQYLNQGGFDLLGTGRTKIETPEQFAASAKSAQVNALDGLIIVGGDDSNTNAAYLADYFLAQGVKTSVVGVPKTIDGDLKNQWIEASFGFDTAAKTYSEAIGNILLDSRSQKKYTFFIKVMGRTASHLVLECALQTQPNMALIGEEIALENISLTETVERVADLIAERSKAGKDFGAILFPEGVIEFIPEFKVLIEELKGGKGVEGLSQPAQKLFQSFPKETQEQLLLDRDPHGNIQVSKIETERLFIHLVTQELKRRPDFKGKFSPQPLFFGYEGRSALPSLFDCNYCYSLGITAALLVRHQLTGMMALVRNIKKPYPEWSCCGIPLAAMIEVIKKGDKEKGVIKKGLVDLKGKPFQEFKSQRSKWRLADDYLCPGPIQFFGPHPICNATTITLSLE